jgi:hypothetical protein
MLTSHSFLNSRCVSLAVKFVTSARLWVYVRVYVRVCEGIWLYIYYEGRVGYSTNHKAELLLPPLLARSPPPPAPPGEVRGRQPCARAARPARWDSQCSQDQQAWKGSSKDPKDQKGPKRTKKDQKGPKRTKKDQKGPKRTKKDQKGSKRIKRTRKDQKGSKGSKGSESGKGQKDRKDQKDQKDQKDPAVHGAERIRKDQTHPPSGARLDPSSLVCDVRRNRLSMMLKEKTIRVRNTATHMAWWHYS